MTERSVAMKATNPRRAAERGAAGRAGLTAAVLGSLFVPGAGHMMIGRPLRGAVWLAGFILLIVIGAGHLLPGILLMLLAAADTWWMGSRTSAATAPAEDR
jgi:TM2 domain-containing membrane protein YozV